MLEFVTAIMVSDISQTNALIFVSQFNEKGVVKMKHDECDLVLHPLKFEFESN